MSVWDSPPTDDEIASSNAAPTQQKARPQSQAQIQNEPGRLEALGRGALQGLSLGFEDEAKGVLKAVDAKPYDTALGLGLPAALLVRGAKALYDKGPEKMLQDYRAARDEERAKNEAAKAAHGGYYLGGEIAGTLPMAIVPGASAVKAGTAIKGIATAGGLSAAQGGAQALGVSGADMTRGEILDAAKDTAIGAGISGAAGAAGALAGLGAKTLGRAIRGPSKTVAGMAADRVDEVADVADSGQTLRGFYDEGKEIEKAVKGVTGVDAPLSPGQLTGNVETLLQEKAARQTAGVMGEAQAMQRARVENLGKMMDFFVEKASSRPDRLGDQNVGKNIIGVINKYTDELADLRTNAAKPLFDEAINSSGGLKVIPTDKLKGVVSSFVDDEGLQLAPIIKKTLEKTDESGAISVQDAQNLLSYLSKKGASVASGASESQSARISGMLKRALNADMDTAIATRSDASKAVGALREARKVWADYSSQIDEMSTGNIKKLFGLSANDADDIIPKKISGMTPQQIRGVMNVVEKTGDEGRLVADDLRANYLSSLFEKAGKSPKGKMLTPSYGDSSLSPRTLANVLSENEDKIASMFGKNSEAMRDLLLMSKYAKRLAIGPGIEGSQTYPLATTFIEKAKQMGLSRAAVNELTDAVANGFMGKDSLAKTVATPEGVKLWRQAFESMADSKTKNALPALAESLSRLIGIHSSSGTISALNPKASVRVFAEGGPVPEDEQMQPIDPTNLQGR